MELDNQKIGQNIANFRKASGLKAFDMATQLGMKENAYTKYERGETAITIDFVRRVAEALKTNPFHLLSSFPGSFFESISNSPNSVVNGNNNHSANEQQTALMLEIMKSILAMNERMVALLERNTLE